MGSEKSAIERAANIAIHSGFKTGSIQLYIFVDNVVVVMFYNSITLLQMNLGSLFFQEIRPSARMILFSFQI